MTRKLARPTVHFLRLIVPIKTDDHFGQFNRRMQKKQSEVMIIGRKKTKRKHSSTAKEPHTKANQVKINQATYQDIKKLKIKKKRKTYLSVCFFGLVLTGILSLYLMHSGLFEKQLTEITATNQMTNDLSKLFSEAILNGIEEVDLSSSQLSDLTLTPTLVTNAYKEAYFQNPYMIGTTEHLKGYDDVTKTATIGYTMSDPIRRKKQNKAHKKVQQIVKDLIYYEMDDLQKAKILNDYLCDTITYSERSPLLGTADDIRNIYGALIEKKVVCLGYAYAFKALMDEVGIPCVVVVGHARAYHAWNKILIDERWRVVDVTWNDNSREPNRYFNLTDAENANHEQYDYFVLSQFVEHYKAY